ncbi:MAG: hypothetical protein MMC33_005063 [Icmadophila ericetorum]|nr:hypothetical protein [Icmadophila ericetorum]
MAFSRNDKLDGRLMPMVGGTKLHQYAHANDLASIKGMFIADSEMNVDEHNSVDRRTALSIAADEGNTTIVAFLLSKGANPNSQCTIKRTPLSYAASQGHAKAVEELLNNANTDKALEDCYGRTPADLAKELITRVPAKKADAETIIALLS